MTHRPERPPLLNLKAAIVRRGIEFRDFAAQMRWRPDYLSHVLAGRKAMPESAWIRAAHILGLPESQLRSDGADQERPAA